MDLKTLDNIFEKGILGLVLATLLFSALATGAVRTLEFAIVETLVATAGLLWLVRIWVNPNHKRLLLPPVVLQAYFVYSCDFLDVVQFIGMRMLNGWV